MQNWKLPLKWQDTEYIFSSISNTIVLYNCLDKNSLKIISWMDKWMHACINEKLQECVNVSEGCIRELDLYSAI